MNVTDRLADELRAADAQIHDLVTEVAVLRSILRKQANAGAHVVDGLLVRSSRGPLALTDDEAGLFTFIAAEVRGGTP